MVVQPNNCVCVCVCVFRIGVAAAAATIVNIPTQIVPHAYDSAFASLQFQYPWPLAFEGFPEDRAASASKSHSQAEKRRRDRINAQLATLRKLIPKSDKMDKAALLGNVVYHVKDLKRKAMDVSKSIIVPSEIDEVTIIECDPDQDESYAKVKILKHNIVISVCCDDRPELFSELIQVLKGLRLINQDHNIFRSSKQLTEVAKQKQQNILKIKNIRKSESKIKKAA
ncbi:Transcription factor [Arachis hypogaea]|nr:Transcription factor [Arachis hypogaea]